VEEPGAPNPRLSQFNVEPLAHQLLAFRMVTDLVDGLVYLSGLPGIFNRAGGRGLAHSAASPPWRSLLGGSAALIRLAGLG